MKTAVSIGTFDAVHLGHQALVQVARSSVGASGKVEIWSLDPPPMTLIHPTKTFHRITTIEQREKLFESIGVDVVRIVTPTQEFLQQTPQEFVKEVVEISSPSIIVEGEEFRFGKNRQGTIEILHELGAQFDFKCLALPAVEVTLKDHSIVQASSSLVRWLICEGRVEDTSTMLGRPYSITGTVEQGDRRGRTLGIHTANLGQIQTMLPKEGIYAGKAFIGDRSYVAAISIGTKPTFGQHKLSCEAHLLDFSGEEEEYGWSLTLEFSHWIRNQISFDTAEDLIDAIQRDVELVSSLIRK